MKSKPRGIAIAFCLILLLPACARAYYSPEQGRWISRDPIGEKGDRNVVAFVGNDSISGIDPHGHNKWEALLFFWPILDIANRCGLTCPRLVQWALCDAEAEASRVAPDGSFHYGSMYCLRAAPPNRTMTEGDDADLLTHCISACKLTQSPGGCASADNALEKLQARELQNTPGSRIDFLNNNVGSGVGVNIGRKGNCTQGCLDALNDGLLYTIVNGQPAPHPRQPRQR